MGIKDLLKELKPIINRDSHLSHFYGKRAGVDASCWLHRSAHSCAWELISGKGTDKYLKFLLKCIQLLQRNGVIPVIVFDGAQLPMKANEEHRRGVDREKAKREAIIAHQNKDWERRWQAAQRAVRTTKEMLKGFIDLCVENDVQFVCSPYEADAQLGYMYKHNQIDFVISEDSDLMLYGVREVFYKLDVNGGGNGHYLNLDRLKTYKPPDGTTKSKKNMNLCLFLKRYPDLIEMIHVCVLSGCDYLNSLPGIGLKTAVKKSLLCRKIDRRISLLVKEKKKNAPKDYHIQFKRAVLTFCHQRVYDINTKKLTFLNPLTDDVDAYLTELKRYLARTPTVSDTQSKNPTIYDTTLNFLGKEVDDQTARLVAEGKLDARSLKPRNITGMVGYRPHGAPSEEAKVEENENSNIYGNRTLETSRLGLGIFGDSASQPHSPNAVTVPSITRSRSDTKPDRKKKDKYFGRLDNEEVIQQQGINGMNGNIDGLLAQFGYKGKSDDDNGDGEEKGETAFESLNLNSKVIDLVENPLSDDDDDDDVVEELMEENRPLKRTKSRKRKRNEMEQESDIGVLNEVSLNPIPRSSRRRLNESVSSNTNNISNQSKPTKFQKSKSNPDTTPQSRFIKPSAPKNVNTSKNENSIIGDLFWSAVDDLKKNKSVDVQDSDDDQPSNRNKNKNNPFSTKKKPQASLALIGASSKPTDGSGSDTEDDDDESAMLERRKKTYSVLRNMGTKVVDDIDDEQKGDKLSDEFYNPQSEEEEEDVNTDHKIYDQSSQSANERQMMDQMRRFEIEKKMEEEGKDLEQESEDDDLVILSGPKVKMEVKTNKMAMESKKTKNKGFKRPRFKDGTVSKKYGKAKSLKAKKTTKTTKAKGKKVVKGKSKGQKTLNSWFKKQ